VLTLLSLCYAATDFVITADELKSVVREHTLRQAGTAPEHVTLSFVDIPEQVVLTAPVTNMVVRQGVSGLFHGLSLVHIEVFSDDQVIKRIPVTLRARILKPVLVASERIDRHAALTASMVHTEYIDATALRGAPVSGIEEVVGRPAARLIAPGQPLVTSMIEWPPVVRRGDRITLRASSGSVTVTAAALALSDARAGETVFFRNMDSGKEVSARVVEAGLAVVRTSGGVLYENRR